MPIAFCTLEIYLSYAQSLKEKRMVLRKLQDRLRAKFNFSLSEIDHQDLWQRALIGAVSISGDRQALQSITEAFVRESEAILGDDLVHCHVEYIDF
ncbi:MAG: DUF503 domain-containing protein [Acidobacteria bacterium]|nr:DUF503 domain-containing protein [Acidobacteriota bacterium]